MCCSESVQPMLPDFLLQCTACGAESVWDTDALPPVGRPEVGHPVLWLCQTCGAERRHTIVDLYVVIDKLHHEICLTTELDRSTVDQVMAEIYRRRRQESEEVPTVQPGPTQEAVEVAESLGISLGMVERIYMAEAAWMLRQGYIHGRAGEG
jgi:hypothetical protein